MVAFLLSFDPTIKCKVIRIVADAAWPLNDHPCEEGAQAAQLAGFFDKPAKRYNRLLRVHRIQTDHELLDALDRPALPDGGEQGKQCLALQVALLHAKHFQALLPAHKPGERSAHFEGAQVEAVQHETVKLAIVLVALEASHDCGAQIDAARG